MICPACSSPMNEVRAHATTVDLCPGCKGIWFDDKELVDVLRALVDSKTLGTEKASFFADGRRPVSAKDSSEANRSCPRCKSRLVKYNYAYDSNVILDKCPGCQGIWADGGEVWQIVQFLKRIQGSR
jgi:uncharacterized protein